MNRSRDEIARLAQYITETSAHDARGERMAYYADLRNGGLVNDDARPTWRFWAGVVAACAIGFAIGAMTMPDVPIPAEGFGHEYCGKGC